MALRQSPGDPRTGERMGHCEELVTLVAPVRSMADHLARRSLVSVVQQTTDGWRLLVPLLDVGRSDDATIAAVLSDSRVRVTPATESGPPLDALSGAEPGWLETPFVAFLPQGAHLEPHALGQFLSVLTADPDVDVVYADADWVDSRGVPRRSAPLPDWSPQLLRSHPFITGMFAMRAEVFRAVGGLRAIVAPEHRFYDLLLRLSERRPDVAHLRQVLTHLSDESEALEDGNTEAGQRAVIAEHYARSGLTCSLGSGVTRGSVVAQIQPQRQLASIIIPTRGSRAVVRHSPRVLVEAAVRSVLKHDYSVGIEVVVVHDVDADPDYLQGLQRLAGDRLRIVEFHGPFNFAAKINRGVERASGDLLVLLNDDIEVISERWLDQMVGLAQERDVGAVGAKLLFEDGSIQHAGIMYHGGLFQHVGFHMPNSPGVRSLNFLDREVIGVTAACMALRRDVWDRVGGMDETLPNNFNDVDLCWRLRSKGYRVVQANSVCLYHYESMSRQPTVAEWEAGRILGRLGNEVLGPDPFTFPEPGEAVSPGERNAREWLRVSAEVWRTEGPRSFIKKARTRLAR